MTTDPMMVLPAGADLTVDARGPDPIVVQFGPTLHVDLPEEPLTIMFQTVGMPGRDGQDGAVAPIEAVAGIDGPIGLPVAFDRATGRLIAADAAYKPAAFVVGLLAAVAVEGFSVAAAVDRLTLPDWSAIAGSAQLVPGLPYFLAQGGGLTPTPPVSSCVAMVGSALNSTTLLIAPQPPIEL